MAGVAEFRFYGELNDLLPSDRRQRDVRYQLGVGQSVKDAIEALGVPHTEVDLIVVNGEPAGFDQRLDDGDRVSVFPVFETLDVGGVARLRPEPLRQPRFVADAHLGKLARYLRLLGLDVRYDAGWPDAELADISVNEHRTLLTRDRGLLKRGEVTHGLLVRSDDPEEQAAEVVARLHLQARLVPFTRCMACNGMLADVDKYEVIDRLEPRTRRHFETFRRCLSCGRVYWEGSHHDRLEALVERVRRAAS